MGGAALGFTSPSGQEVSAGLRLLELEGQEQVVMNAEELYPDVFERRFWILKDQTPSISLARCRACGQAWYLGVDLNDDVYHLSRLNEGQVREIENNNWPRTFDGIDALWPYQSDPRSRR